MNLVVRREEVLGAAMELLRAEVLGCAPGTTRDSFDARSSHVVAYADGLPVGMVRETRATPSLLSCWARGKWALPSGAEVVELTRGVVAPDWRRHGVYRLLMLEVMASLPTETVSMATAAIEEDFVGRRFLEGLGFCVSGAEQPFWDEPREMTLAVPILTLVDTERRNRWQAMLETWKERLAALGVTVSGTASPSHWSRVPEVHHSHPRQSLLDG